MKVVIVGGVAGGATAAARIRRLDEKAEIIIFEKSGFISYANCGLPYFIGDVIKDESLLTLQTPQSFKKRFNIDVKVKHEVIKIIKEDKKVVVKDLESGTIFTENYDKLLLSPGAKPIKLNFAEGNDKIFTLRNVEDTVRIKEYIESNNTKSVAIVGGGYVGLELAENIKKKGLEVTLIQDSNQVMNNFDEDMAAIIHSKLKKEGIKLLLNSFVTDFKEDDNKVNVIFKNKEELKVDIVIVSIGILPESKLAKEARLELGIKDSIVVNERMETSEKDIYAVGDAVQIKNSVTDKYSLISLAGPANKQGRIAADNICGGNSRYNGGQGSSIIKLFDMTAAITGLNEKNAKALSLEYDKVYLTPMSHAGYYPNGKTMTMKIIFEKQTGRILGAQIIGYDGVDKRIDVLGTAIYGKMTAFDLKDLDLAYSPPYSSAKDPVNMAGFIIENIITNKLKQYYYEDLKNLLNDKSVTLLDTRTVFEYNRGHIDGYINIPVDELRDRINELDKNKPVYVICQSGLRSYIACRILSQNGFDCYNYPGGYGFYLVEEENRLFAKECFDCGMEK